MCVSVDNLVENCCKSNNDFVEARPIEENISMNKSEMTKNSIDDASIIKSIRENETSEKIFISDYLALFTQCTRKLFKMISSGLRNIKSSKSYTIVTKTTQPAHFVSILLVLFVSYSVWPEENHGMTNRVKCPLMSILYLASFAAHFGAQIWMTFVSGLALYFSLPRHTFGMCQEVLFPKYFLINTLLSTTTLISFTKIHMNFSDLRWVIQLLALSICFIIEMIIFLYLTGPLLKLMRIKYQYEQKLGNGQEIGYQKELPAFECPEYKEAHKSFRKIHFKCAIGNLVAICCTTMHLYYLASKISITL